ncbi:Outer membrane component of tripartite multidrug resistance system [Collimonas arenae]|uniref:Outer membrane component of tripartite multidrug resistance system n=1 Tax=Collimonas arenae TaxID=279058 RepID=A0A0A1FGZ3_9BURK|nr:efflux transporter outer membrane subunit [Collimonas arenae]AIY42152.1 Outer membrane component of tripartite multidrug resistance system [Collimonas arenae]
MFPSSPSRLTACAVALLACLAGCAPMPPAQQPLPQRDLAGAQLSASIHLAREGWPDARWWSAFGDPQLDALMAQALQAAPTLQVAASRIDAARSTLQQQHAADGFGVDLNAATNRQRYSSNGLFPAPIGGSIYNETTLQAQASYDFDWWGLHRAQIAAALGEVNARKADYAQAERSLSAAVAGSYFNLQDEWARLDSVRKLIGVQETLLQDSKRRVAQGLASIDLQHRADASLADSRRLAADLDAQASREREALRALLGDNGDALADLKPRPLPDVAASLPSTLGMELLARRADLQAARWRVEASLSRIDAARAAFYPDINLKAFFGVDSLALGDLLTAGSRTFFVGPALSLPLFDSGRLQARLGAERVAHDGMIADYNQAVVNAVRDVAQEGATLQGLEHQLTQQAQMEQAASALLGSAQRKFDHGLTDRASVLDAQTGLLRQQESGLQLRGRQLQTEIALTKALGGGFRQEPSQPPVTALATPLAPGQTQTQ